LTAGVRFAITAAMDILSQIRAAPGAAAALADEDVLAAAFTSYVIPRGVGAAATIGPVGGAVGAVVVAGLIHATKQELRNPLPFSVQGSMVVALTPSRLLFWTREGFWRSRPTRFVGRLPIAEVENVELSRRRGKLALWLRNGKTVELDVKDEDIDLARGLTDAACERIAAGARAG
jgi:hypothetical protein